MTNALARRASLLAALTFAIVALAVVFAPSADAAWTWGAAYHEPAESCAWYDAGCHISRFDNWVRNL